MHYHPIDPEPCTPAPGSKGGTLPRGPNGYILSYGVSYADVPTEKELLACPASAKAVHAAFVSKCGFSPAFCPTLNEVRHQEAYYRGCASRGNDYSIA